MNITLRAEECLRLLTAWQPAADWMSAATFISMAGSLAIGGYDGSRFLMGWTGGFVLLTVLDGSFFTEVWKSDRS